MNNRYLAEVLWAVAADLDRVTQLLWERPEGVDPAEVLAVVTLGRDDMSRRVACANMAVAAAILDRREPFMVPTQTPPDPFW